MNFSVCWIYTIIKPKNKGVNDLCYGMIFKLSDGSMNGVKVFSVK